MNRVMIHILVEDLSFRYQGTQRLALDGINLEIIPGEFVLITGPSGCGKSTLVDCLNGLIPHRYKGFVKGTVYIDGKDWFDIDYNKMSVRIGLVRQDADSQLACMDVESEIAYGPKNLCLNLSPNCSYKTARNPWKHKKQFSTARFTTGRAGRNRWTTFVSWG